MQASRALGPILLRAIGALATVTLFGGCTAEESVVEPDPVPLPARPDPVDPPEMAPLTPTPSTNPLWVSREAAGIVTVVRSWNAEGTTLAAGAMAVTASFFGQRGAVDARPAAGTCQRGAPELASTKPRIDAGTLAVESPDRGQGILVRPSPDYRYLAAFEKEAIPLGPAILVRATGAAFPMFQQLISWAPGLAGTVAAITARREGEAEGKGTIDVRWPPLAQAGIVLVALHGSDKAPNDDQGEAQVLATCSAEWSAGHLAIDTKALGLTVTAGARVGVQLVVDAEAQVGAERALIELRDARMLTLE